jgi:protein TonB
MRPPIVPRTPRDDAGVPTSVRNLRAGFRGRAPCVVVPRATLRRRERVPSHVTPRDRFVVRATRRTQARSHLPPRARRHIRCVLGRTVQTTLSLAGATSGSMLDRGVVVGRDRGRVVRGGRVGPTKSRVSAVAVSLVLHAVALAAGAWIQSGASFSTSTLERPGDSRYEARVVERSVAVDEVVAPTPTFVAGDPAPAARGGDDPVPALDPPEADDVAPPAAAPTIAVDGGSNGWTYPTEWSSRPTLARSAFVGHGHGGRRCDGAGAGGRSEPEVVQAMSVPEPDVPSPPPPQPAVRVDARMLAYSAPEYPECARERGLEGAVRVEVEVLADATVGRVRVVQSSGVAAFDDAAVAAVRKWRFAAATLDGVAFASTIALPAIRFRLE